MFVDYTEITLVAGIGGSGCMAFQREPYNAKGGPSGGDGGAGGSIFFQADENLSTLLDIRYHRSYKAPRGGHGKGANQHGKKAKNLLIKVPVGTVVKDKQTNKVLFDFVRDGQKERIVKGGRGGKGNARFATPTNRAPKTWEYGRKGEIREVILEIKLFADVGLVGFPNAGKSTLLSVLSSAKPKIADYPFTTLEPQLGIVTYYDIDSFSVADIPGIIEGASEGRGLGHKFLKHIERTKTVAFVIDGNDKDIESTYHTLKLELSRYSKILFEKPSLVVLTKSDLFSQGKNHLVFDKQPYFVVSALTKKNITTLIDALWNLVKKGRGLYDIEKHDETNTFDF